MISVLTVTYNREDMLSRAIESTLDQTYKDFELVIVDNGSADNSGKIADEYAKKDDRIRVIHLSSNIGPAGGRNTAVDAARGDYTTFVDDDDWAEPDYLEFLLKLMIENDADMSICGSTGWNLDNSDEKCVMTGEQAVIELMRRKKYNVAPAAKMYRKELWKGIRYPENAITDDIWVTYKLIANSDRVAYHGAIKYMFYKHDGNNSATALNHSRLDAKWLDEYLRMYRTRTEELSKRFPNSADAFKYFEWSFMISMAEKINRYDLQDCEKHLIHITSVLKEHREDFLNCPEIQDFEREWMDKFITG